MGVGVLCSYLLSMWELVVGEGVVFVGRGFG